MERARRGALSSPAYFAARRYVGKTFRPLGVT